MKYWFYKNIDLLAMLACLAVLLIWKYGVM